VRNAAVDRWWTAVELPRRAAAARADVLHHSLPAAAFAGAPPQVVTLHDLGFERLPAAFDPRFRAFARRVHRAAARRAAAVVCVSETTARDAAALWGVPGRGSSWPATGRVSGSRAPSRRARRTSSTWATR